MSKDPKQKQQEEQTSEKAEALEQGAKETEQGAKETEVSEKDAEKAEKDTEVATPSEKDEPPEPGAKEAEQEAKEAAPSETEEPEAQDGKDAEASEKSEDVEASAKSKATTQDAGDESDSVSQTAQESSFFAGEASASAGDVDRAMEGAGLARVELNEDYLWEQEVDPVIPTRWRPYIPLSIFFLTLWLMFQLSTELRYYWAQGPQKLGDISSGCKEDLDKKVIPNSFVSIQQVLPDIGSTTEARVSLSKYNYVFAMGCDLLIAVPSWRYKQMFGAKKPSKKAGKQKRASMPLMAPKGGHQVEQQGDIRAFSIKGRLLRLTEVASLKPVRDFYERSEYDISRRTLVLFDGETPGQKWWVLLLYGVFVVLCVMSLQRFFFFTREAEDDQAALEAMEEEEHANT